MATYQPFIKSNRFKVRDSQKMISWGEKQSKHSFVLVDHGDDVFSFNADVSFPCPETNEDGKEMD